MVAAGGRAWVLLLGAAACLAPLDLCASTCDGPLGPPALRSISTRPKVQVLRGGKPSFPDLPKIFGLGGGLSARDALARGDECMRKADYEGAVNFYTRGITNEPDSVRLYSARAAVLMKMNRIEDALKDALQAKSISDGAYAKAGSAAVETFPSSRPLQAVADLEEEEGGEEEEVAEASRRVTVRFQIRTAGPLDAGQAIYVCGSFPEIGAWVPSSGLSLREVHGVAEGGAGGRLWEGEVSLPVSMRSTKYKYVVVGGDGLWRWETSVPQRELPLSKVVAHAAGAGACDPFEIDDGFFDVALPVLAEAEEGMVRAGGEVEGGNGKGVGQLVPEAGVGTAGGVVAEAGMEECQVGFRVTVHTNFGEEVVLCGSDDALGAWSPAAGLRMATNKDLYPDWIAKVYLPAGSSDTIKYKYVIRRPGGALQWEDAIADRQVKPRGSFISIADGEFNQPSRAITFQKLAPKDASGSPPGAAAAQGNLSRGLAGALAQSVKAQSIPEQITHLEEKNADLQRLLDKLEALRAHDVSHLELLRAQVAETAAVGGEMQTAGGAAAAMLGKLQGQLAKLEAASEAVARRSQAARSELATLRKAADEARASMASMRVSIAETRAQAQRLDGELQRSQQDLVELTEETEAAHEGLLAAAGGDEGAEEQELRMQALRQQVLVIGVEMQRMEEDCKALEVQPVVQHMAALQLQVAEAAASAARNRQQANVNTQLLATLEAREQELRQQTQARRDAGRNESVAAADAARALLQSQVAAARMRVAAARDAAARAAERQDASQAQVWAVRAEEEDLRRQVESGGPGAAGGGAARACPRGMRKTVRSKSHESQMCHNAEAKARLPGLTAWCERAAGALNMSAGLVQGEVAAQQVEADAVLRDKMRSLAGARDALEAEIREQSEEGAEMQRQMEALSALYASFALREAGNATVEADIQADIAALREQVRKEESVLEGLRRVAAEVAAIEDGKRAQLDKLQESRQLLQDKLASGEVPADLQEVKETTDYISMLEAQRADALIKLEKAEAVSQKLNASVDAEHARRLQAQAEMVELQQKLEALAELTKQDYPLRQRQIVELRARVETLKMQRADEEARFGVLAAEKDALTEDRREALAQALDMSASAQKGKEVLMAIQEALVKERTQLEQVSESLQKEKARRVMEDRGLQQHRQRSEHLGVMLRQARHARDQVGVTIAQHICMCVCKNTTWCVL